jgi:hypothetical protein
MSDEQPSSVEDLERDLQAIQSDLRTAREHQSRIERAARHLAEAVKKICKPGEALET